MLQPSSKMLQILVTAWLSAFLQSLTVFLQKTYQIPPKTSPYSAKMLQIPVTSWLSGFLQNVTTFLQNVTSFLQNVTFNKYWFNIFTKTISFIYIDILYVADMYNFTEDATMNFNESCIIFF